VKFIRAFLGLVCLLALFSCQFSRPKNKDFVSRKEQALKILEPYLQSLQQKQLRFPADTDDPNKVKIFLPLNITAEIAAPSTVFTNRGELSAQLLETLKNYLIANRAALGSRSASNFSLEFVQQNAVGNSVYVRYRQVVLRSVGGTPYVIPIEGAVVIARILDGRLKTLNSQLTDPPSLNTALESVGFRILFTENELAHFMGLVKANDSSTSVMRIFITGLRGILTPVFGYNDFLNRQLTEQRRLLERAFSAMGTVALRRFLIRSAQRNRASFVRYGTQWRVQIVEPFELPIIFDVNLPEQNGQYLEITNLRHVAHKTVSVVSYESPYFPGGEKRAETQVALRAQRVMTDVVHFFDQHYGWTGFEGKNSQSAVEIHTQLRSLDFVGNAAWLGPRKQFIVGEDGSSTFNLVDSHSVLGHEFSHAVVQFSSALAYRGESGAINEHFADIQGASVEASFGSSFDFTIGKDILRPEVKAEKEKLLDLIFLSTKYSQDEIRNFSLDRVGLRHLFAPILSFSTQLDHLEEARKQFPLNCQPSIDNDNCGVHAVSGVANKAASLIIATLGLEQTQTLFFNTIVYRLSPTATLEDYITHLHEECLATPALASQCSIVLASFAAVGVVHPQLGGNQPPASPTVAPVAASVVSSPIQSESPELKFCGWVDLRQNDDVRIFDNRYNATMITRNNVVRTQGDFITVKGWQCACAKGRITQTVDRNNQTFNAFTFVSAIENRGDACNRDPRLQNIRPPKEPIRNEFRTRSHTFCGWVSVNSRSQNIHIIDNRYDAALLASGYRNLTRGDYSAVYKQQCSCVTGRLDETTNSRGTVFNYFSSVEPGGIQERPKEACLGIQWR
jgi:hypothetical protein